MATHETGQDRIGWSPSGRSVLWAAAGGIAAAVVIGIPMHAMGMLAMGPARLVGSDNVWVGWLVHLAAGVVFGAPYGLFVHARRYGRAARDGAAYGLVVGVAFAWLALFSILDMPLFSMQGLLDVMLHVLWGVVIGLVSAWGLRRTGEARTRAGVSPG